VKDESIARDVVRDLLREVGPELKREQEVAERSRALIRIGKVAGIPVAELARLSDLTRPTIYEILRRQTRRPADDPDELVLAGLASQGAMTRPGVADLLGLPEEQVSASVDRLLAGGALSAAAAGYGAGTMEEIILLSPAGVQRLAERRRRAPRGQGRLWTGYLAVDPAEGGPLLEAAEKRFGRDRTALLPVNTTWDMASPELAIAFEAADQVSLFNQISVAWHLLRDELSLEPAPPQMTAFSPPRITSTTLGSLAEGILKVEPGLEARVRSTLTEAEPLGDEVEICVRALTEAAWALRRSVGHSERPPPLADGELAFAELEAASALHLDGAREEIQTALLRALGRAADHLGPFPGGRLGAVRGAEEGPRLVEEVAPTPTDLTEIALASGEALGSAHEASGGAIDAVSALGSIVDGVDRAGH
jgi:hypothetical protein